MHSLGYLGALFSLHHSCYRTGCTLRMLLSSEFISDFPLEKQEQLTEHLADWLIHMKYYELLLIIFCLLLKEKGPEIGKEAVNTLLRFSAAYLCQLVLMNIKNKTSLTWSKNVIVFVINFSMNWTIVKNNKFNISH